MKKQKLLALLYVLCIPMFASANGSYAPGSVRIAPQSDGSLQLQGNFNVRYNPAVSQGYVSLGGSQGLSIGVIAQDSYTGSLFLCYSLPGDALYPQMLSALSMATNGATISASYNPTQGLKCTQFSITISSQSLD